MNVTTIALDDLHAHPANANVMPGELLAKLKDHLARSGRYPPIIVRVHPQRAGGYQVLDGHHRVAAMRELGWRTARCDVWDVDDTEAMLLLTTLNQLRGQDDPRKRAALVSALAAELPIAQLAGQLPEDALGVSRLVELHQPAPPRAPRPLRDQPRPVHFFLLPAQRDALEKKLRDVGGRREDALLQLLNLNPEPCHD